MSPEPVRDHSAWRCELSGCSAYATVRHDGLSYCAVHALAELVRRGVLNVETVIEPVLGPVVEAVQD